MKQHRWAKEIKAWADGAEIECRWNLNNRITKEKEWGLWINNNSPDWNHDDVEFRIKPQPKEPRYLYVYDNGFERTFTTNRCGSVIKTDNPNAIYKYIGKIKLEQDDEKTNRTINRTIVF